MDHDLEMQRYLFDLAGFMVIPDILSQAEIDELKGLIDAQQLPPPREKIRFGSAAGGAPECPGFLEWGKPFCDLLDHPRIMPLLQLTLGDWFRLDRLYGINMEKGMGAHQLHGGNAPYSPAEYYHVRNGRIHNAFTVVSWNLADTGPEHGGFCCIPGSHKSNFVRPDPIPTVNQGRWEMMDGDALAPGVVIPEAPAGSVVLFSEALTHGTAPWNGACGRPSRWRSPRASSFSFRSRPIPAPGPHRCSPRPPPARPDATARPVCGPRLPHGQGQQLAHRAPGNGRAPAHPQPRAARAGPGIHPAPARPVGRHDRGAGGRRLRAPGRCLHTYRSRREGSSCRSGRCTAPSTTPARRHV